MSKKMISKEEARDEFWDLLGETIGPYNSNLVWKDGKIDSILSRIKCDICEDTKKENDFLKAEMAGLRKLLDQMGIVA